MHNFITMKNQMNNCNTSTQKCLSIDRRVDGTAQGGFVSPAMSLSSKCICSCHP